MALVKKAKHEFVEFIGKPKEALGVIITLFVGVPIVAIGYMLMAACLLLFLGIAAIVGYIFLDVLFEALDISWWIW